LEAVLAASPFSSWVALNMSPHKSLSEVLIGSKKSSGYLLPQIAPYLLSCGVTALASGGVILGVGPFSERLISDGYITVGDVGTVFTGAFQIMTLGTLVAVHGEHCWGPRVCAAMGAAIMLPGYFVLANLPRPVNPLVVMAAYGLLGWGGNHIYISSFQFSWLFPERVGLADGVLVGCYSAAGMVLLVLDMPSVSVVGCFRFLFCLTLVILIVTVVLWPNHPYKAGDRARITWPVCPRWSSVFDMRAYRREAHQICSLRFCLYAVTFSWSCVITMYVGGNLQVYYDEALVGSAYFKWAFPLITNPTFVAGWAVGHVIDRTGFAFVTGALIFCCQLSIACLLLRDSATAAWLSLFLLNLIRALQFTIEFVFLHKTYESSATSVGLLVVITVQALFGFIANPGLDPNPWGSNYVAPALLLGIPTFALYAWPVLEWRHRRLHRHTHEFTSAETMCSPGAAISHAALLGPALELPRSQSNPDVVLLASPKAYAAGATDFCDDSSTRVSSLLNSKWSPHAREAVKLSV